jgi:hypothetical protein
MRLLVASLFALLTCSVALAQPAYTTVSDTFQPAAGGAPINGTVTISWTEFTYGAYTIPQSPAAGQVYQIVNNSVNIPLVPTDMSAATVTYKAVIAVGGNSVTTYWSVPTLPSDTCVSGTSCTVQEVTVAFPPGAPFVINPSQISAGSSTAGQVLCNVAGIIGFCNASSSSFTGVEVPAGIINGSNTTFSLSAAPNPSVSLLLAKNGVVLEPGVNFTLSGTTITFLMGSIPQTNDTLIAWYNVGGTGAGGSGGGGGGGGSGGGGTWGSIIGVLTNQIDLEEALQALVPYTGATAGVNLGANAFSAFSESSNDTADTGALDLVGKTSHSTYTEMPDDNTQAQTEVKPAAPAPGAGYSRQTASATAGVYTEVWSNTSPFATALAATPTGCPTGQTPNRVDAQGNALGCLATSGSASAVRTSEYWFCSRDSTGGDQISGGIYTHGGALTGGDDNPCWYQLPANGSGYVVVHKMLDSGFSNAAVLEVQFYWSQDNSGTLGNVDWNFATYCAGAGSLVTSTSPSYNSPTTVTAAAPTNGLLAIVTPSALSITGCAANDFLYIKIWNTASGSGGTTFLGPSESV